MNKKLEVGLVFKNKYVQNGMWFTSNFASHKWQLLSISLIDKNGIQINQIIKLQDYLDFKQRMIKIDKANQNVFKEYYKRKKQNKHLFKGALND